MATHDLVVDDALYQEVRDQRLLGFLFFLISDVIIFSSFIYGYIYLRSTVMAWPSNTFTYQPAFRIAVGNARVPARSCSTPDASSWIRQDPR